MTRLTPNEIAKACENLDGRANIAAINKMFRHQDESRLFPIRGRFNVTERAIRQAQKFQRESGQVMFGLEYAYLLDEIIGQIVNNENNW